MDQPNLYRIDECVHEISKFHEGSQFNPFKAEIMNLNEKGVPLS